MKILLVTDFFPTGKDLRFSGGVEARTFFVARELAKRNDVFIISARLPQTRAKEKMFGFTVYRPGPMINYNSGAPTVFDLHKRLSFIFSAISLGKKISADVVDGGNFSDHFIAKMISNTQKIPVVFWYPDVFIGQWIKISGLLGGFAGYLLEKTNLIFSADLFIAISNVTSNKLIMQGVDKTKVVTIPCGVESSEFKKKVHKSKITQIICISRLVSYKRIKDLLFAFVLVERELKKVKLLIVGSGPQKKELLQLARELKILNKIQFLENLSRMKLVEKIKESHLFVLPSAVEGFGISTIESAAGGVPYVVSDIPVFREVTKNGKGGLLFNLGSPTDLAAKIKCLLQDDSFYRKKIVEAKGLAGLYNWAKIAVDTEKNYQLLTARK